MHFESLDAGSPSPMIRRGQITRMAKSSPITHSAQLLGLIVAVVGMNWDLSIHIADGRAPEEIAPFAPDRFG